MNVNVNELPEYESKAIPQCIFAMASSGDYTFEQAITVYTLACDRCKQVLLQKYLKGPHGYFEYSDAWKTAGTECKFCKDMNVQKPVFKHDNHISEPDLSRETTGRKAIDVLIARLLSLEPGTDPNRPEMGVGLDLKNIGICFQPDDILNGGLHYNPKDFPMDSIGINSKRNSSTCSKLYIGDFDITHRIGEWPNEFIFRYIICSRRIMLVSVYLNDLPSGCGWSLQWNLDGKFYSDDPTCIFSKPIKEYILFTGWKDYFEIDEVKEFLKKKYNINSEELFPLT